MIFHFTKSLAIEHKKLFGVLLVISVAYFSFSDKAFNIDDTMFLRAAEQILVNPADFYGGYVNWYGHTQPHHLINKNPPLVSYLIAAVVMVFGAKETPLHVFFFLPLLLSSIGIYLLGREFKTDALLTLILAAFTPVYLVHSTNVMSDSTMLMFWVWGVLFWMTGIRTNHPKWFFLTAVMISLGTLTKYTCIFLLPLILFSGLWKYKKLGAWTLAVLIPLAVLLTFEAYTKTLYGKGLFLEALYYSNVGAQRSLSDYLDNTLIGLSFLGGCFPVALLLTPYYWRKSIGVAASIFVIGALVLIFTLGKIGTYEFISPNSFYINSIAHFCVFTAAGICLILVCLRAIKKDCSHDSIFLILWFLGVLVFAIFLNWTINARSFILLVPVVGILLSKRIEESKPVAGPVMNTFLYLMIGTAGLIAVLTTKADYAWAGIARTAAQEITSKYGTTNELWFQGHWGFQHYMEKLGAQPMEIGTGSIPAGAYVVVPFNNTNVALLDAQYELVEKLRFTNETTVSTMSPNFTSGFYSSLQGPVPFIFEGNSIEHYFVYRKK